MAVWALVMTATYTANLASLFVQEKVSTLQIANIQDAIAKGVKICTYGGSYSGTWIESNFPTAVLVPKPTEEENFRDLNDGKCGVVAVAVGTWEAFELSRIHNPHCDLERVGKSVVPFFSFVCLWFSPLSPVFFSCLTIAVNFITKTELQAIQ